MPVLAGRSITSRSSWWSICFHSSSFGFRSLVSLVRVRVSVRVAVRVKVKVKVRVRVWLSIAHLGLGSGLVLGLGGLLPTPSHSIFYSRVGQIAIFSHCQP